MLIFAQAKRNLPNRLNVKRIELVNGHTDFLHDGRARNFEEAILWHGGKSNLSKSKFEYLSKRGRDQLISFLKTL